MHTTRPTPTLRFETASLERSPNHRDSVGDGHVALPLWYHAREATEFITGLRNKSQAPGEDRESNS
uniref:Pco084078 n=1 Tax=Arundo donax TaxID=35708 RepID=A0A0A9D560_ARUDO